MVTQLLCSIAGIVSKKNMDVAPLIVEMLSMLKHRGPDLSGIATRHGAISAQCLDDISLCGLSDHMAIGYNGLLLTKDRFISQPLANNKEDLFLVLDGEIYGIVEGNRVNLHKDLEKYPSSKLLFHLIETDQSNLLSTILKVLPKIYGEYSFAVMKKNHIIIARDVMGIKPLYWGENEDYVAFASERKPLWKLGITVVSTFPPGYIGAIDDTMTLHKTCSLAQPEIIDVSLDEAAARVKTQLFSSLKRRLSRVQVNPVAVSFSGGLDSSLTAKAIEMLGTRVILYSVGLDGAHDIEVAENSASKLDLPLRIRIISPDEIENYICKVIYAIEESNIMKIGVGIPLYVASELANKDKIRVMLTGQGADELFAGYDKYLRLLIAQGYEQLQSELWKDLKQMYHVNLQRDNAVTMANSVGLICPFLDLDLVNTAMSLHPQLKIEGPTDFLRKHVLRIVAQNLGLPEYIVSRPKKSVQYGSGTDKAIRELAKKKGFKHAKDFLHSVFQSIFTPQLCLKT